MAIRGKLHVDFTFPYAPGLCLSVVGVKQTFHHINLQTFACSGTILFSLHYKIADVTTACVRRGKQRTLDWIGLWKLCSAPCGSDLQVEASTKLSSSSCISRLRTATIMRITVGTAKLFKPWHLSRCRYVWFRDHYFTNSH